MTTAHGPLPNFFVLGAMKAGTTTLNAYLQRHPDVFMSKVKEPHHYSDVTDPVLPTVRSAEEYARLFRDARGATAIGEASASYLWSAEAARRLAAERPEARLVVVLRDPISRAHSHYLMSVRNGLESRPFPEALRHDWSLGDLPWGTKHLYVELGQYAPQVRRYLEHFGRDRLFVTTSRELRDDTRTVVEDLCRFLGVSTEPVDRMIAVPDQYAFGMPRGGMARRIMASRLVRDATRAVLPFEVRQALMNRFLLRDRSRPAIEPEAVEFLRPFYEDQPDRLESMLGRPFPQLRYAR